MQTSPAQELHDEVANLAPLADIVDGYDVGVAKPGRRPRFEKKALEPFPIGDETPIQQLDRHVTLQARVRRPVDGTHGPLAEHLDDPVAADALGEGGARDRHGAS